RCSSTGSRSPPSTRPRARPPRPRAPARRAEIRSMADDACVAVVRGDRHVTVIVVEGAPVAERVAAAIRGRLGASIRVEDRAAWGGGGVEPGAGAGLSARFGARAGGRATIVYGGALAVYAGAQLIAAPHPNLGAGEPRPLRVRTRGINLPAP